MTRSEPTRIAFVSPRFHTNEHQLVADLVEAGREVTYFVHESGHSEDWDRVRPLVLGYLQRCDDWDGAKRLRRGLFPLDTVKRLERARPDVVVLKGFRVANLILALQLRWRGIAWIVHVQRPCDVAPPLRQQLFHRLFGRHVVTPVSRAPSPAACLTWTRALGQRWYFAPFVARAGAPRDRQRNDVLRLLVVGKFQDRKRILPTLRLVDELRRSGVRIEVTVVGTVADPSYLAAVADWVGAHAGARLAVGVPHRDMSSVFAEHDVFVMPSVREAASYSQLEAMAHGMAVIVSDDNGTANYVVPGETGEVLEADGFFDHLGEVLTRWSRDPLAVAEMGEKAQRRVTQHHGHEAFLRALGAVGGRRR